MIPSNAAMNREDSASSDPTVARNSFIFKKIKRIQLLLISRSVGRHHAQFDAIIYSRRGKNGLKSSRDNGRSRSREGGREPTM